MKKGSTLAVLGFILSAASAHATVVLTNGSFESIGTQYSSAIGGIYAASGWTNQSGLNIQAGSVLAGVEGTNAAGVTGSRFLRLASDNPDPANTGFIVQNMGTMVAGETYKITGDVLGGASIGQFWGATVQLTSDGNLNPATVYSTESLSGWASGTVGVGAIDLTYTATAADNGNPLFIWLRAEASGPGTDARGGIDNLALDVSTSNAPEPATVGLGLASLSLLAIGRRFKKQA